MVSRYNRFTVPEKLVWDGTVVQSLDEDAAREVAREIARRGITSVAVCFINGYQDTRHEVLMREIPGVRVALSGENRPKVRELGRFTTTTIRAAMLPVVGDYMSRLEAQLQSEGCSAPLSVVKSNGGKMGSATAKERPEELIASGPAGGVAAEDHLCEFTGLEGLLITDVGGLNVSPPRRQNLLRRGGIVLKGVRRLRETEVDVGVCGVVPAAYDNFAAGEEVYSFCAVGVGVAEGGVFPSAEGVVGDWYGYGDVDPNHSDFDLVADFPCRAGVQREPFAAITEARPAALNPFCTVH